MFFKIHPNVGGGGGEGVRVFRCEILGKRLRIIENKDSLNANAGDRHYPQSRHL